MIMARITIDGKLCQFSTKQSIQPENWNVVAGKAKGRDAGKINSLLDDIRASLNTIYHETNDRTNVVIEFTKTEYADGTTETKTEPPEQHPGETGKPKPGTENKGGIKSVTTGKITINGDRKETTATTATETGERKAETQTSTGVNADKTATVETEQEKKPKRGLLDWIFLAGIVAACAAGIAYAVKRR